MLKPALAPATAAFGSLNFMYNLIWWSVTCRPGKGGLSRTETLLHTRSTATTDKAPLEAPPRRARGRNGSGLRPAPSRPRGSSHPD